MADFQLNFEWDPIKAASNLRKHGIEFERAATVFHDPQALSLFDEAHSAEEERWITLGLDSNGRLLVVCHTWRERDGGKSFCRIISARPASKKETRQYPQP